MVVSAARSSVRSVRLSTKSAPARAPRAQLVGDSRVHADAESRGFQLPDRILEMRERRIRQAAEVDHVGARLPHRVGARQDGIDRKRRCIDDLGEDADVVARQVEAAALAEIARQVLEFVRPALERHAELGREAVEIGAAAARHQDPARVDRPRQAAGDDGLGHQRRDLHADVEDGPVEGRHRPAPDRTFSSRGRARCPVRNRMCSRMRCELTLASGVRAPARARPGFRPPASPRTPSGGRCSPGRCGADRP